MKKILVLSISFIMFFCCLFACTKKDINKIKVIPDGYTELSIKETNGKSTEGFGCQIDTHVYKNYNYMSDEELEEFYKRITEMNLQSIRTQIFPEWFERGNDNNDYNNFDYDSQNVDFNSIEMTQLYKLLDFCEKNNIKVDLSIYGCQPNYRSQDGLITKSWLASQYTKNWITSPKLVDENGNSFPGLEEFAENVYALLNYVLTVKEYTCVSQFSVYPEPNLSYITATGNASNTEYVELIKLVNEKLKNEGIRDKILFAGPANANNTVIGFGNYIDSLGDVFDLLRISSYNYDSETSNDTMFEFGTEIASLCSEAGKTFGLAEFGSKNVIDSCHQTDIDTYDRALFLARYMINLVNTGTTAMNYWEISDMYYGDFIMELGLWKYRNNNWVARPQYYTWSLITKYTDIGSVIYPIKSEDGELCAIAFKLPDGNWSYMICNSSNEAKKISFVNYNSKYPKSMNLYEVRASKLSGECKPINASSIIDVANAAINVKIGASSFVVLSTK